MDSGYVPSIIRNQLKPAMVIFFLLTLITGIFYPLFITGIAQLIFPVQANGNFVVHEGKVVGSALIGQPFTSPRYFWGRPSATSGAPYNAGLSSGSNLGPSNPALINVVNTRVESLHAADPANKLPIPVDLVTSSASGLDPDISVASAYYQVHRIALARTMSEESVHSLVTSYIEPRQFWIFGEPRVNVLALNLALDDMSRTHIVPSSSLQPDLPQSNESGLRVPDWIVLMLFFGVFVVTVVPLGRFMVKVINGEPHILSPLSTPLEHRLLAWAQVKADEEMDWKTFAIAMMVFSLVGIVFLFVLQLVQAGLPLNPAGVGSPSWDLSLNTAVSFVTNTDWQAYAGETGVSYLTQMMGLCVQNFTSAATGMAVLVGLIYGLSRRSSSTIGNFWVLLIRSIMILLPLSIILALILISQGAVQTLQGPVTVPLLDPVQDARGSLVTTQTIPLGPVASQVAIKQLGVNGGGFFNTNSAHPFENPTPFSNFIEIVAILLIPAALCYAFGRMVGAGRKGISILIAMTLIFIPLLGFAIWAELGGNPAFTGMGIDVRLFTAESDPGCMSCSFL